MNPTTEKEITVGPIIPPSNPTNLRTLLHRLRYMWWAFTGRLYPNVMLFPEGTAIFNTSNMHWARSEYMRSEIYRLEMLNMDLDDQLYAANRRLVKIHEALR